MRKPNRLSFRPSLTQTELYKHRRWLETGNFGFRKYRDCTIRVVKTKGLISFAVTTKLFCVFVFPYAECLFSHDCFENILLTRVIIRLVRSAYSMTAIMVVFLSKTLYPYQSTCESHHEKTEVLPIQKQRCR